MLSDMVESNGIQELRAYPIVSKNLNVVLSDMVLYPDGGVHGGEYYIFIQNEGNGQISVFARDKETGKLSKLNYKAGGDFFNWEEIESRKLEGVVGNN